MANAGKMAAQLGVTVRTFTVTGVHPDQHSISLGKKHCLPPAGAGLGADVVRPKLEGNALDQVFSINDLQDYRRFRACLEESGSAYSRCRLIGCEFANDLLSGSSAWKSLPRQVRCCRVCCQRLRQGVASCTDGAGCRIPSG